MAAGTYVIRWRHIMTGKEGYDPTIYTKAEAQKALKAYEQKDRFVYWIERI